MEKLRPATKKATIVIVDDEQSILKELRILLGRMYQVHVFANPEEVEPFVDTHPVDLIISDEMMPEMRGSVLLGKIHQKHPDICNIVLSGQAEKDDIVRAVNEGHIFSFLYKPTERQQLLNVIEKGLENRNMKMQLAEQNVQLKEYSENLEQMVEEKTAQLVKAYDKLNMLDTNKMYFLIYLSEEMDSSLDRIQLLAGKLLNYFAFAGADLDLQLGPINLLRTVETVVKEHYPDLPEGMQLEMEVPGDLQVMADSDYLSRVIRVLVDNAFTFSAEEGTVTISAGHEGGHVQLSIADTGKGIERDNLKKVFMPFVISRKHRSPQGFGLNLPMAKTIVSALGGKVWAESEGPGHGSRFCLELRGSRQ